MVQEVGTSPRGDLRVRAPNPVISGVIALDDANDEVEEILRAEKKRATEIIEAEKELVVRIVAALMVHKILDVEKLAWVMGERFYQGKIKESPDALA